MPLVYDIGTRQRVPLSLPGPGAPSLAPVLLCQPARRLCTPAGDRLRCLGGSAKGCLHSHVHTPSTAERAGHPCSRGATSESCLLQQGPGFRVWGCSLTACVSTGNSLRSADAVSRLHAQNSAP